MHLVDTLRFITSHPLNRGNKVLALCRYVAWQIRSRLTSGPVIHTWVNGSRFMVRKGETGLTGNVYTGLHEFVDMAFLLHFLRAGDLFVDVGANVGSYTILACAAAGANGIAFEPVPATFQRLVGNMRLNKLESRVMCVNKGVGSSEGVIAFSSSSDTTNHALAAGEQCENPVAVAVTTLDDALRNSRPALMKIDVEGFETPVLEGARQILQCPELKAVIIELNGSSNHYGFDESRILQLLLENGFRSVSYNPLDRTLHDLDGKNPASGNTLFVRDAAFVSERLKNAQSVSIHGKSF